MHRVAGAMSSLAHGGASYHWTSVHQGNLGLYQLAHGRLDFKEGPAGAATVLIVTQDEAAELWPVLKRFSETGLLD